MNKVVREHYPASRLPEELRGRIGVEKTVTVTVVEEEPAPPDAMTLDELFALRRPPYLSAAEIDDHIRRLRDEWDG
jgi:hypothetical protein